MKLSRSDSSPRVAAPACGGWMMVTLMAAALGLGGCGNYSNEDLDFLSALPESDDVSVSAPLRTDVRRVNEDEALKTTLAVTTSLNSMAAGALAFIDKIRTYTPSGREPGVRIWGPFPDDNNPGWQVTFRMELSKAADGVTPHFEYHLFMTPPAAAAIEVISGVFESKGLAGGGTGNMVLRPKEARDAGAVLKDLEKLVVLTIKYDHQSWPHALDVIVENEMPVDATAEAQMATYHYERAQNGDGGMTFTVLKDVVMGPAGNETLAIESRWHGTGEGRSQISVQTGDGAGIGWTDCWAATALTSYNSRTGEGDVASCIP